jgi:hypothetical protein
VILGKGHVGENVGLGLGHEGGEPWKRGAQLIGDLAPLGLGGLPIILGESRWR